MTGRRYVPVEQNKRRSTATESEAKRPRVLDPSQASPEVAAQEMCRDVHQVGLVGGESYDSKAVRLEQLLQRLPPKAGSAIVLVDAASFASVGAIVERCRSEAAALKEPRKVATPMAAKASSKDGASTVSFPAAAGCFPPVTVLVAGSKTSSSPSRGSFRYVINYDLPSSAREYLRRLTYLKCDGRGSSSPVEISKEQGFVYTCVEDNELKSKRCRDFIALLKRARQAAADPKTGPSLGGITKATEFDSALEQLQDEEEDEDDDEDGDDDEECDCNHCHGGAICGTSYHSPPGATNVSPAVEAVRLSWRSLENLDAAAPLIATRLSGHVCTVICLHCLNVHTPWDGWEHIFASEELGGPVRVIFVLADEASWHNYPDSGTIGGGGTPWLDILDVESMDKTDALLERLVEHEVALLGGRSERVVLMGMSQGGGQSMLRFLRSKRRLGGWIGHVCHAPIGPHTPRDRDPLLSPGRSVVNCDRPMRLLVGDADVSFSAGLVLRDVERLRNVGGFTDVEVTVQKCFSHDGFNVPDEEVPKLCGHLGGQSLGEALLRKAQKEVPDLLYLRRHLPSMIGARFAGADESQSSSPDAC